MADALAVSPEPDIVHHDPYTCRPSQELGHPWAIAIDLAAFAEILKFMFMDTWTKCGNPTSLPIVQALCSYRVLC